MPHSKAAGNSALWVQGRQAWLFQHQACGHGGGALLDFGGIRAQDPTMAEENSDRLHTLESHIAHLEHLVEQLNGVVIEQGKLLDRLNKETRRQCRAMQTLELERIKTNVQKPPHYQ
jgi:SlyX protein